MSLRLQHTRSELPNGVVAYAVPLQHIHRVVISAHIAVGPRYEPAEQSGVSHFLEHMLYRGTPRSPSAHEQALAFERLGGTLSAATYIDHGSMAIAIPPQNFEPVLELFADVFKNPIFAGLEIEKGIVREEILESLDDNGHEVDADNLIRTVCFGDHPLGRPITGTLQTLETFDTSVLREYHARHYVGASTVIAISGPIDPERALSRVAEQFGDIARGQRHRVAPPAEQHESRFRYVRHVGSQTALRVGFRAPSDRDRLEPATEMLIRLIDDGMSTRLYHEICDARGLCYDVSAGYEAYSDSGLFDLAAETAHERAPTVLAELFNVVRDLRDNGPHDAELEKAHARCLWQLQESLDEPAEIADAFGFGELMEVARSPSERYEQLRAVTREQIREVAEQMFRSEQLNVVAVGVLPKKTQATLEQLVRSF